MTYKPRIGDIATDLARCLEISKNGDFENPNFKTFLSNAKKILKYREKEIASENLELIRNCVHTANDKEVLSDFRRDSLALAIEILLELHLKKYFLEHIPKEDWIF